MSQSTQKLLPVPFTRVALQDSFWKPRQEINRRVTLEMEYKQCKDTGRADAFRWKPGQPNTPHIFWDSDMAKWIEAAAYSLIGHPDATIEARVDDFVESMAAIQGEDGYVNSTFSLIEPQNRWTHLRDRHELYCAGHLIEAAVAYEQATGKSRFLDVMCKYADHIDRTFGREDGKKRGYPGHEELELALVKLFRATGEQRYIRLAEYFVNERGKLPHYYIVEAQARGDEEGAKRSIESFSYAQAHKPVREQTEVVGHAVRAMYLYSGMADVAAETGDRSLIDACKRLWKNVTRRRMHVTGGIGPSAHNEGFTFDYDMPNETAYNETCANIGLAFWALRMLHMDPNGDYADVMELALYNSVISGISLSGDHFFYANPLAAHPGVNPGWGGGVGGNAHYRRSEWFGCACCPPNVARLLASFGSYLYSEGPGEIRVNLYATSTGTAKVGGQSVQLKQQTDYPWDGRIKLEVTPERPATFVVGLRIPGWARSHGIKVNGKAIKVVAKKGYAQIKRLWAAGDHVELTLPMPVEFVESHPNVRQNTGRVAMKRGPVVYCLEGVDNGNNLSDLVIQGSSAKVKFEPKLLGGVAVIAGKAKRRNPAVWSDNELYKADASKAKPVTFKAVPYATWCNRAPGEMQVWLQLQR